jgi:hypothetical protein
MSNLLTERRGVNAVEDIFINEFGWIFREQAVLDFGIDAQTEVVKADLPTGQLIALQIKTGRSYFRLKGSDYVYYGESRHLGYWLDHSLPVILILHEPDRDLTLWQKIDRDLTSATDKGWSIVVPSANVLSGASKSAFEAIAARIPTDAPSTRRARMAMDLDLIKRIAEEPETYFELEHWVNKSLGMRGINIMFGETDKAPPDIELEWMYPVISYEMLMARYFPWLAYEHIETRDTATSEIDIIVLHVWVSDLGKSYLAIEDYFANGVPDPDPPDWYGFATGAFDE